MMQPFGSARHVPSAVKNGKPVAGFDSAAANLATSAELSITEQREQASVIQHIREQALHVVSEITDAIADGDLGESELPTDRLDSLMVEALGELDDDDLAGALGESIGDALSSLGVDDTVIDEIFSDDVAVADAAIEAMASTVLANLPDEGEPLDTFTREFIFGDDESAGFDSAGLAAGRTSAKKIGGRSIRYKAVKAIRNGVIKVVNKRLAGQTVRRTSAQKAATKKAGMKARSGNAIRKRLRSLMKGKKAGLY